MMMLLSPVSSTFIPQINVYRVSAREVAGYSQKCSGLSPGPTRYSVKPLIVFISFISLQICKKYVLVTTKSLPSTIRVLPL